MILKWEKVIEGEAKFHIAAASDKENSFEEFHGHDFYELLYLEKGSFIHNINNEKIIVNAGELIFISPQDKHQIIKNKGAIYSFYNIAFSAKTYHSIQKRFQEIEFNPITKILDGKKEKIIKLFIEMVTVPKNNFYIELFIMNLTYLIRGITISKNDNIIPNWLAEACEKARNPKLFRKGTKEFIKTTNRCHEHVIRELKKYTKMTPSQYLTKMRMEYAGQELIISNKEIFEISMNSGFESLNYFYQKFKEFYGITPRKYRIKHKNLN